MATGFEWPWERAAMRLEGVPEGLSLPDQMAYTTLRNVYAAYKDKKLDREQAAAEKKRLRYIYDRAVMEFGFVDKQARHYAALMRETEAARTECRLRPSAEAGLRLCNVLDGLERHNTCDMSMTDLYVRDRSTGKAHRVGDDIHDSLFVDENCIVQYYNLQNGDGTLCGDPDEKQAGYEFVRTDEYDEVDEETAKQAKEYRAEREEFHRRQRELAERGILMID